MPEPLPDFLLSAIPREGLLAERYRVLPVRKALPLQDGDEIDLGDRKIIALHFLGHSPGSVGPYDAERRALFSGDVVYGLSDGEQLLDRIRGADIVSYISSLQRRKKLKVNVTYPGHGDPLDPAELAAVIDEYLIRRDGMLPDSDSTHRSDDC